EFEPPHVVLAGAWLLVVLKVLSEACPVGQPSRRGPGLDIRNREVLAIGAVDPAADGMSRGRQCLVQRQNDEPAKFFTAYSDCAYCNLVLGNLLFEQFIHNLLRKVA